MQKKHLKTLFFVGFLTFLALNSAFALFFRLDGDRLWLQADETPLSDILDEFTRLGVSVRADPQIQSTVTIALRGVELDAALEKILASHDYFLTWRLLRGPLGKIPKLQEIQVFRRGIASSARKMPSKSSIFEVSRGISGKTTEYVPDELLIGVKKNITYPQFQRLLDEIGGMIVDSDPTTGIYLIRFPRGTNVEALLRQIARNDLIAHAELNHVVRLPPPPRTETAGRAAWPAVRPPADGSVPVAVLDSGLNAVEGLNTVISAAWDAISPEKALTDPAGHGTQMALIAAGVVAANGMAAADTQPVVAVRAFDEEGKTSNFAIFQALAYAAQAGAKVVNMSWGSEVDSSFMRAAMQQAAARGLILVAAAGNQPHGRPVYPAAYPEVIAVAGVTASGEPWQNSNHGDFVALSAPAAATLPVGHNGPAGGYAGTSISSAVVANALAQYLNQHPTATPAQAWNALQKSLSPAPTGYGDGILDHGALQRLLSAE